VTVQISPRIGRIARAAVSLGAVFAVLLGAAANFKG
jgi:hypothetical protein